MPTRSLDWYAEEWHEEQALADELATELEALWEATQPTNMQIEVDAVLARWRERKAERD